VPAAVSTDTVPGVEERSPIACRRRDVKALIGDATDGYGGVRHRASVGRTPRRFVLTALYDRRGGRATEVRNRLLAGREDAFRCDLVDAASPPRAFDPGGARTTNARRRGSR
jgi:hypothetical protein